MLKLGVWEGVSLCHQTETHGPSRDRGQEHGLHSGLQRAASGPGSAQVFGSRSSGGRELSGVQ